MVMHLSKVIRNNFYSNSLKLNFRQNNYKK
jgi:hypothetical protein